MSSIMSIQHPGSQDDPVGYGSCWFSVAEIKMIKTKRL